MDSPRQHFNSPGGRAWYLYGVPAYQTCWLIAPFKENLTRAQRDFDKRMSRVRIPLGRGFEKITALWPFLDFRRSQKIWLIGLGKHYTVAALLTNCHSCFYGNQTAVYFGVATISQ
ncbi:unnamed protein product [Discosporangium mesarthrocarpum]